MAPLAGITVLDLSRVLAGPYSTQLLADLGARIITVEAPTGDETRAWGPPWAGPHSGYYFSTNRGKESIAVNLKHPEGAALVQRLAAQADVLVENFKVGDLARYGLDYPTLKAQRPELVYVSITGYGQTGPRRNEAGYDAAIQAETGLMAMTGEPGGAPVKLGVAWVDVLTGTHAATAALAGVIEASRTGHGRQFDISLYDVAINALVNQAQAALITGKAPERLGSGHPSIVPYQAFPTKTDPIVIAVGNDRQFARFAEIIDAAEWVSDERFATNSARVAHRELLTDLITEKLAMWDAKALDTACKKAHVPVNIVQDLPAVLRAAHTLARGLVVDDSEHGPRLGGSFRSTRTGAEFAQRPVAAEPPRFGQHTKHVLATDLGLSEQEIAALHEAGAVLVEGEEFLSEIAPE